MLVGKGVAGYDPARLQLLLGKSKLPNSNFDSRELSDGEAR